MADGDARWRLELAGDALQAAYTRARAAGYRPGSAELRDVQAAKQHYQLVRRCWHRETACP